MRRYVVALGAALMMIGLTALVPTGPQPAAATALADERRARAQTSSTAGTDGGATLVPAAAPAVPTAAPGVGDAANGPLTPVEAEIVRLTNELRSNPAGALARREPLPSCVSDPFYAITISPDTGLPSAVPPLTVDDGVTLALARPWAATLQGTGRFEHRSSDEAHQLYGQLGLPVGAWGENIAWFTGFDITQAARIHFEGWRESDAGHYCALVSPRFTHLGVGAIEDGGQSWAVQNFYG
ncbi:MAG: CAP domain-containing protein [Acidimicrobiales bacterium]